MRPYKKIRSCFMTETGGRYNRGWRPALKTAWTDWLGLAPENRNRFRSARSWTPTITFGVRRHATRPPPVYEMDALWRATGAGAQWCRLSISNAALTGIATPPRASAIVRNPHRGRRCGTDPARSGTNRMGLFAQTDWCCRPTKPARATPTPRGRGEGLFKRYPQIPARSATPNRSISPIPDVALKNQYGDPDFVRGVA